MDRNDGSVLVRDLLAHPKVTQYAATGEEIRIISRDIDDGDKLRLEMFKGPLRQCLRVRALNGHSLLIDQNALPPPEEAPWRYRNGTTLEAAHAILKTGVRCVERNDIHMIEYHHTPRGAAYLKGKTRKHILLTIDGPGAASAGIKFAKLTNEAIIPKGTQSVIPPCLVLHPWLQTDNGPIRVEIGGIRQDPPVIRAMYNAPEQGAHGLLPQYRQQESEERARRTPSPAIVPQVCAIPSVPEVSEGVPLSQHKSRRPVSPSPEALNLPEQERPPSWQETLFSPEKKDEGPMICHDELPVIPVGTEPSPHGRES